MIVIAHRGNYEGKNSAYENMPSYIDKALDLNYDVEIDLRVTKDRGFWLGHDDIQYQIDFDWLQQRHEKLWIHCKNHDALLACLSTNWNYFWHDIDQYTLTSHGYIWSYPDKLPDELSYKTVLVMPEHKLSNYDLKKYNFFAVCTDDGRYYETD